MKRLFFTLLLLIVFNSKSHASYFMQGDQNAKLQIILFGDYQCPYTLEIVDHLPRLDVDFGNKIGFTFVDFPLASHSQGLPAALAAVCADNAGVYRSYSYQLFLQRKTLSAISFVDLAIDQQLDSSEFQKCMASPETMVQVLSDRSIGRALGVTSTPTLFFGGEKYSGSRKYDDLKAAIDKKLGQ